MALSKQINLDNGSQANYFNIESVSYSKGAGSIAVFNWYASQAIREAHPEAILSKCELSFPDVSNPDLAAIYEAAKTHPSGVFSGASDA